MSNITALRGLCPAPFLDITKFPANGGFVDGRICSPVTQVSPDLICCLPCPTVDWIYPQSFKTWSTVAGACSTIGLVICAFLLISWIILPADKTRRHYLSVCLVIGVCFIQLGFVIPLAAQPQQCYNEITPNDMFSNLTCAWSGAFVIAGGLATTVWIFIRALSMHLQICWDVQPGRKFFYVATGLGWGVIALLFTITITFTGVSFRFGEACHVNSKHALEDFWGPLLGISGASALVQALTFGYCIKVYLANMWSDEKTETGTTGTSLPSYSGSLRTHSAKAVYKRVRKVVWLQWRGMLIIVFILTDVIFLSVVFVFLNSTGNLKSAAATARFEPWLLCLIQEGGRAERCLDLGQNVTVNEGVAVAVIMLLALGGVQTFITMSRWSMFVAWYDLLFRRFKRKNEFVSLDARQNQSTTRSYELIKVGSPGAWKSVESSTITSPASTYTSTFDRTGSDYFSGVQRDYKTPSASFSSPRPPSSQGRPTPRMPGGDWDPTNTFARSDSRGSNYGRSESRHALTRNAQPPLYSPREEDEMHNRI